MKKGTDGLAKFLLMLRDLKLPKYAGKGLLQDLWDFTALNAPEGNLGKFTNEEIALSIGYESDPDELIEVLLKRGWLDEHGSHRIVVHDWSDHCEDSIHDRLAKERRFFASGNVPKLTKLRKEDRPAIERDFKRMVAEREQCPNDPPPPSAIPTDNHSSLSTRASTPYPENERALTRANAPTEPSRAEPNPTLPNHAEPHPTEPSSQGQGRSNRSPRVATTPPNSNSGAGSAVSISDVLAIPGTIPREHANKELFQRLLEASSDPPGYRPWWRTVYGLMVDCGGLDRLSEAITYAEQCGDDATRRTKDLGRLKKPGAYIASACGKFLAPYGKSLPPKPTSSRAVS